MTEYALYRGDEIIMIGTIKDIAKHEGVREKTVKFWGYPSYINRIKDMSKSKILVKIEEDEG